MLNTLAKKTGHGDIMYTFSVNERVLYGSVGVCEIRDITQKDFGGKVSDYYILVPLYRKDSTVYVPVDSEQLCEKIRKLPTKYELDALLDPNMIKPMSWDDNKYTRRDSFNEMLEKGNTSELLSLIKLLIEHNIHQLDRGKKLHITDERVLTDAQKLIEEEIACVLDTTRDAACRYIKEKLGVTNE